MKNVSIIKEGNKISTVKVDSFDFFQHIKDNDLRFFSSRVRWGKNELLVAEADFDNYRKIFANPFTKKTSRLDDLQWIRIN